ncbi:MAG: hypothetical protein ACLRWM_01110 [Streptococcus sp.]
MIFEDYFIHSDLYMDSVTPETFEQAEPISNGDTGTAGLHSDQPEKCRVVLENIEVGTTVILWGWKKDGICDYIICFTPWVLWNCKR